MPPKQEISAFIGATFRSVWAVELLCLLRRNRDRSLAQAEMVAGLRGSDLVVTQSLASLAAAGLVLADASGAARYSPVSDEVDRMAARTELLYAKSPNAVRHMIVAAANPAVTALAGAVPPGKG